MVFFFGVEKNYEVWGTWQQNAPSHLIFFTCAIYNFISYSANRTTNNFIIVNNFSSECIKTIIYNNNYIEYLEFAINGYSMGIPPFLVNIDILVTAQFPSEPTVQQNLNKPQTEEIK